jgi:hypothetical protein
MLVVDACWWSDTESIVFLYILAGKTGSAGTTWERELITLCGRVCLPFLIPAKFEAKNLE